MAIEILYIVKWLFWGNITSICLTGFPCDFVRALCFGGLTRTISHLFSEDNSVNVTVMHDGGLTGSKVELGAPRWSLHRAYRRSDINNKGRFAMVCADQTEQLRQHSRMD